MTMSVTAIGAAIQGRNLISFQYSLGKDPVPDLLSLTWSLTTMPGILP